MYIIRDFFMYTLTEEVFTENNGEKQKFLSMYINMEMYIISRTSTKYRHKLYFVLKKEFHWSTEIFRMILFVWHIIWLLFVPDHRGSGQDSDRLETI